MSRYQPVRSTLFSKLICLLSAAFVAGGFLIVGGPAPTLRAAEASTDVQLEKLEWGFGGFHKLGKWTPVTAQIKTTGPAQLQLVVEAVDPDGATTSIPGPLVKISQAGQHQLTGIFKNGRANGTLGIRILNESSTPVLSSEITQSEFEPTILKQDAMLIATVGPCSLFSDGTSSDSESNSAPPPADISAGLINSMQVAQLPGYAALPTDDLAYDGLDVLAITASYDIPPAQNDALRRWVRRGGKLILAVGKGLAEYQSSLMKKWVPVPIAETGSVRELTGLEQYVDQQSPIRFRQGLRSVPIAMIGDFDGAVLAKSRSGPILVRHTFGLGEVTFLGLDTNQAPLADWNAINTLGYRMIWGKQANSSQSDKVKRGRLAHTGITDFQTQIRACQENFPQIERVPTWGVLLWIAGYLMVIGPIDYLLVRRILRKPHLTWVTFPLMVAISVFLAIQTASTTNAKVLVMNQLDLTDIDSTQDNGVLRTQSWVTLYSPETRRYRVAATATPISNKQAKFDSDSEPILWQGIPEQTFGGMYRAGGFSLGRATYQLTDNARMIENLPIAVWSTQNLESHWQTDQSGLVTSQLVSRGFGRLEGAIVQNLNSPIKNWMIAFGTQVFRPKDDEVSHNIREIAPGKPLVLSPGTPGLRRHELRNYLTGVTQTVVKRKDKLGDDIIAAETEYDLLSRDPGQILETLTFYRIAGGEGYTGLKNHSLRTYDLSHLVDARRAILFGEIESSPSEIKVDGESVLDARRTSFVRIVLPVEIQNQ